MGTTSEAALLALRAIGEATRLRIVTLLEHGELSVSELTDILDQSQPRISRHLRLLIEANVIERHREGNRTYFSLSTLPPAQPLVAAVLDNLDPADPTVASDLGRLDTIRAERAATADAYFSRIAPEWEALRSRHAADAKVEATISAMLADDDYASVLDLGTGTGRMLHLLAEGRTLDRMVGVDTSAAMLAIARSQLDEAGLGGVELRQSDLHTPPVEPASFDVVIIHQVLHYLDDPDRAVQVAARMVAPGGHLVVVDFAPHDLDFLQTDFAHRRLGFRPESVTSWMTNAGLESIVIDEVDPDTPTESGGLTVLVWRAARPIAHLIGD